MNIYEQLAFLDYIHNGIIVVDKELRVVFWNRWLEFKTFIKKDAIAGTKLYENFNYINEKELKRKVKFVINFKQQSFYTVEPHKFLIDIQLNNITNRTFELMQQNVILAPFTLNGSSDYAIIHIHDVTELEATNQKLKNKIEEIKQQQALIESQSRLAAMGEMMENITHQWKQPLNTILSLSRILKNKIDDKKLISKIYQSAEFLYRTVNDFRNFSVNLADDKSTFNLNESIESTLNIFSFNINKFDIKFDKSIENKEILICGKISEFNQVLLVILNNAKDALEQKESSTNPTIFIKTKIKDDIKDDIVELIIEDNGTGIPKDLLIKIFEPYFTTKFRDQGTGIGLNMAYNIIKKLNGSIVATSSDNGAIFTINLPILKKDN